MTDTLNPSIQRTVMYKVGEKAFSTPLDAAIEVLAQDLSGASTPTDTTYAFARKVFEHSEAICALASWVAAETEGG